MTKHKLNIINANYQIDATIRDLALITHSICLEWFENGARFHVWLDHQVKAADKPALSRIFKRVPGSSTVRMLDPDKPVNVARIAAAKEQAGSIARARVRKREELEAAAIARDAEQAAAAQAARIREAGPALLAALEAIIDLQGRIAGGFPLSENQFRDWSIANHNARAAIRNAKGE